MTTTEKQNSNWNTPTFTEAQIAEHYKIIDTMSHVEMAKLRRYAAPGHIYFNNRLPFYLRFENRFQSLGGMTPEISKRIEIEKRNR